jgi:ATP-dependent Lon protease
VRKTVSGLLKILHPDGTHTSDELQEYLELALEGRRRIKEQLKKRGSFEFYKTSFSYIDLTDGIERTVGIPEQRGKVVISQDPLPPGTIYTATADGESHVALYRLEVTLTAGTSKLRTPAGMEHGLKESLNRAWSYLKVVQDRMGLTPMLAQKDLVAEAVDLSGGRVECACGVAFLVAMLSALGQRRVQAGTLVLGDLTIQGNIKALPSITEVLQMALENGALRVLLPTGNKIQFSSLPEEVVEKMDIIFYSDADRAITKAVEM